MTLVFGALGQTSPVAVTLVTAYTVPIGKRATVVVVICNRAGVTTTRVSHAINGAADAVAQYMLFDSPLAANETIATLRFTAKAGDVVRVQSASGSVSFNVNGIEEAI